MLRNLIHTLKEHLALSQFQRRIQTFQRDRARRHHQKKMEKRQPQKFFSDRLSAQSKH